MTNLTELLAIAGERAEGRPMLVYQDREISHAELAAESRRVAAGLKNLGIGKGDRVACWLPNAPAYLAMFFACARLGAIALAVNTRYRSVEVADIAGRAGAKAMIYWPDFKGIPFNDMLSEIDPADLPELRHLIVYSEAGAPVVSPLPQAEAISYDDLAASDELVEDFAADDLGVAIFTTSGTTSKPKFVLHHQSSIADHGLQIADRFGWRGEDVVHLVAMPYCGVFGLTQSMGGIASGRTLVTMPFLDIPDSVRLMKTHKVTHTAGSDDMYNMMLQSTDEAVPFPAFRSGIYALFNPALEDIVERAEARGMYLTGVYGMSEVQALYCRWPDGSSIDVRKRGGGIPIGDGAACRVRDNETGDLLGPGQPGELELRGPSMMMEYFLNPEATGKTFTDDGFVRTGDLAQLTEDGGFEYLSRMGDVLRLGGFLVAPAEIEARLLEHPSVSDVQVVSAVVGGRSRAVAFVIPAGGDYDEAAVIAHCDAGLAKYKVPARVIALDAFPVTQSANGIKIQKAKLRQMAESL
ncbi:MAG: AMP-binding protein [Minwuia sp.]|uniref:AMP-binding protein n=1 Tax=Minwuia sp. TaxID=2493630 RepID=UPI003A8C6E4E